MADYYPLITKAVARTQNAEDRQRLYERGRKVLRAELAAIRPPLRQSVITNELLTFEEAISKVEAEIRAASGSE
jgi:hypothetical protein